MESPPLSARPGSGFALSDTELWQFPLAIFGTPKDVSRCPVIQRPFTLTYPQTGIQRQNQVAQASNL